LYHKIAPNPSWFTTLDTASPVNIRLTYTIKDLPRSSFAFNGDIELLVPPHKPYQQHIGGSIDPTPLSSNVHEKGGNWYLKLSYDKDNCPKEIKHSLDLKLEPSLPASLPRQQEEDVFSFLQVTYHTSAMIDPNHPKVIATLDSILHGGRGSPKEMALKIATWVATIPYEVPPPGRGWPTLGEYFRDFRYVECGGHALIFCCLARAAGIPARRIFWPNIEHRGDSLSFGSHMIAEFYDSESNLWFPVDATKGPFDENNKSHWGKIPLCEGGSCPAGLVLWVESMDNAEAQLVNWKKTDSLRSAQITLL